MTCVCTSVVISMHEFHCRGCYNKMCARLMAWRIFLLPFFPLQLRRHLPGAYEVKSQYEIIRICFFSCLYDISRNMTRHTHTHRELFKKTICLWCSMLWVWDCGLERGPTLFSAFKLLFGIVNHWLRQALQLPHHTWGCGIFSYDTVRKAHVEQYPTTPLWSAVSGH